MMYFDVAIVGFGTAGSIAAVAAVRQGMKVLVLERTTYAGGTHTGGCICGYYDGEPNGLAAELNRKVDMMIDNSGYLHAGAPQEIKKIVYEQEVLSGNGRIIYGAWVTGVEVEEKNVKGLTWYDADGRHQVETGVIIDCTGDAVVCAMAGCELVRGRESDGQFQPFTNSSAYLYPNGHVWTANPDAGRIDQTNADEFSRIMLQSATVHLRDKFQDEPARLIFACDLPGLREGPHIVPEYTLRWRDFPDDNCEKSEVIAWTNVHLDNHANDYAFESEDFQDWLITSMPGQRYWFGIPRRSIIPRGFNGILVAGRHLGIDHDSGCAVRMNGCMSKLGEAAGTLAALAVKMKLPPLQVSYQKLAEIIAPASGLSVSNDDLWDGSWKDIKSGLDSEHPSRALWAVRRRKDPAMLKKFLAESESGTILHCHSAIALALLGDNSGLPELRRMVSERDPEPFGRYHTRGFAAVYLLGRLRDPDSVDVLKAVLNDSDIDLKFFYHSYAVIALLKIGETHQKYRQDIVNIVIPIAEDPDWYLESKLAPGIMKRRDPVLRIHIAACFKRWNIPNCIGEVFKQLNPDLNEMNLARRLNIL